MRSRGRQRHHRVGHSLEKRWLMVVDAMLLAHGLHHVPGLAQVMPRQARVQVMLDLELKADVHPIEPRVGVDVHRRLKLRDVPLVPLVVVGAAMVRLHGPMRRHDLHVQEAARCMGQEQPCDGLKGGRLAQSHRTHPREVHNQPDQLRLPEVQPLPGEEQQRQRLHVQVKPSERHKNEEQVVLMTHRPLAEGVHGHPLVVVRRPKRLAPNAGADGHHRHVLDIRIVLDRIASNVVRVMVPLPPARGDAHQGDQHGAYQVVLHEHVSDAAVAEVVAQPGELLPEEANSDSAGHADHGVLPMERQVERGQQEQHVPCAHFRIVPHVCLEEAPAQELLAHSPEIRDVWENGVVCDLADQEGREHVLENPRGMVIGEHIGAILASHVLHGQDAPWMLVHVTCNIVHQSVHHNPEVAPIAVLSDLFHRVLVKGG
mmetsp:Transcript_44620/g.128957  ORF Transcript_44620/g.128957 Transcript_44620/m.128957 type:complete len:429 (+) Transcript_44620:260-1546(+)